ncbi:hypothetical protein G4Y79_03290 [Phototrophicus methaneseepsis]|uniref:STAS/SEC14 domain-containing protein n=1 Tax=Phototrophicus methaneseepsis TaxID=2710758 RepID=A0A7S8EAK4_9CHLR|nr:hypothetical protein [Phototrophicus methaneseepsis]QPC83421.1 hypothetical protein G4Y79_03290 [Phototrophicus methaneseepsis]
MAIQVNWLLEKQIIQVELSGDVQLAELQQLGNHLMAMVERTTVPLVHIVCDETKLVSLPSNVLQLSAALQWLQHPKFGWFLFYGSEDRMIGFLMQTITSMFKLRYRHFEVQDDALDFLASIDTSFRAVV